MISVARLIFWLMVVAISFGCTSESEKQARRPILKVNDESLSVQAFADQLAQHLKNFNALGAKDPQAIKRAKNQVIEEFVIRAISLEWAQKNNVFVRKEDLEAEINKIRSFYPNVLAFRRALAEENLNFEDWREKLKLSLLQKLIFKKLASTITPPSEEELKEYYKTHVDEFQAKEEIHLRQIVADTEGNAKMILDELRRGKKLAELAKKFSITPEAQQGGDLGWIEKGTLDVFDGAFELRNGQRSGIIKSAYGYHIIEVVDRRKAKTKPFNEVKDRILRAMMEKREQAAYAAWLEAQVRATKVFRDDGLISRIVVETGGQ